MFWVLLRIRYPNKQKVKQNNISVTEVYKYYPSMAAEIEINQSRSLRVIWQRFTRGIEVGAIIKDIRMKQTTQESRK